MRAIRTTLLSAAVLLGGASCRDAIDRLWKPPTLAFRGAALRTIGIGGGSIDVLVVIANPNPYHLTATRATYRLLTLDSTEVGHGAALERATIGAHDSLRITLPLDVSWSALGRASRTAAGAGSVDYRIVGDVTLDTPVGEHTVPFDARGRAPLPAKLPFGR
jgi:hypothetical protein